jgi:hypothetical protein
VIVYQRENMSHTQLVKRQAELVEYLRSAMRPSKGHQFKERLMTHLEPFRTTCGKLDGSMLDKMTAFHDPNVCDIFATIIGHTMSSTRCLGGFAKWVLRSRLTIPGNMDAGKRRARFEMKVVFQPSI